MSSIEKDIKRYMRAISKKLISDNKQKKAILSDIENSIYDFAENKGITNISEIYNRFGTPEEVAKSYISQEAPEKLKNKLFTKKILIILFICIILIAFIIFLVTTVNNWQIPYYKDTFTFTKEKAPWTLH